MKNITQKGLIFSIENIKYLLQYIYVVESIENDTLVYISGMIEYIIAEVIELSGFVSDDFKKKTIDTYMIELDIFRDKELVKLFKCRNF